MVYASPSFRNKPVLIFLSLFFIGMMSCSSNKQNIAVASPIQESPTAMMIGSFDSSGQAAADSSYVPITLHMCQIWKDHEDAEYLYVEQAVSSMPQKPYRQRVYKITNEANGNFISEVYVLPYDSVFIGKWQEPAFFDYYGPENLSLREGCAVHLKRTSSQHYIGGTKEKGCISTMRGASYATSQVEIFQNAISSWDQGYNERDEQVWGAENSPYIFKRIK